MTDEPTVRLLAQRAWACIRQKPTILDSVTGDGQSMPPAVALDMVQNETGDRREAALALIRSAAETIRDGLPESKGTEESPSYPGSYDDKFADQPLMACIIAGGVMEHWAREPERFGADFAGVAYIMGTAWRHVSFPDQRVCPLVILDQIQVWLTKTFDTLDMCQFFWLNSEPGGELGNFPIIC